MPAIDSGIKSSLNFINYHISELTFSKNNDFEKKAVSVQFDVNSEIAFIEDNTAHVSIFLDVFKNATKNNYPFELFLSLTGVFKIENFDKERDTKLIEINSVAILFPYLRALVTTITSNANVQPLILPPINIINLLKNKK